MQAYELEIEVPASHRVEIDLPASIATGSKLTLVVKERSAVGSPQAFAHFMHSLERSHQQRPLPSAEEIDARIADARNSWE